MRIRSLAGERSGLAPPEHALRVVRLQVHVVASRPSRPRALIERTGRVARHHESPRDTPYLAVDGSENHDQRARVAVGVSAGRPAGSTSNAVA